MRAVKQLAIPILLSVFCVVSPALAASKKSKTPVVPNLAVGAASGISEVSLFYLQTTKLTKKIRAERGKFRGGVSVAIGDVTGDGVVELVTAAGPGTLPNVRVFSANGKQQRMFVAFDPNFRGGLSVAVGDVNGDGVGDIIVGAGPGSDQVKVVSGIDFSELFNFSAFDGFTGGVNVAAGDTNNDGHADIIVSQKSGGEPIIKTFSGTNLFVLSSLYAFSGTFTGGVSVAAGDVDGDGEAEIIAGAGPGATPEVAIFSAYDNSEIIRFLAFDVTFTGGVSVASADVNSDHLVDVIVGTGASSTPMLRVYNANGFVLLQELRFQKNKNKYAGGLALGSVQK